MSAVATGACSDEQSSDTFCHANAASYDKQHAKHLFLPSSYPHIPWVGSTERLGVLLLHSKTPSAGYWHPNREKKQVLVTRKEMLRQSEACLWTVVATVWQHFFRDHQITTVFELWLVNREVEVNSINSGGFWDTMCAWSVCAVVGTAEVFQGHVVLPFSLSSQKCHQVPFLVPDVKPTEVS